MLLYYNILHSIYSGNKNRFARGVTSRSLSCRFTAQNVFECQIRIQAAIVHVQFPFVCRYFYYSGCSCSPFPLYCNYSYTAIWPAYSEFWQNLNANLLHTHPQRTANSGAFFFAPILLSWLFVRGKIYDESTYYAREADRIRARLLMVVVSLIRLLVRWLQCGCRNLIHHHEERYGIITWRLGLSGDDFD